MVLVKVVLKRAGLLKMAGLPSMNGALIVIAQDGWVDATFL